MSTAAYIRVSTERQADGNGLAQQRNTICAWAAATGTKIDDWATDAETGMSEDREEIQRLLVEARAGTLKRIIIDRLDRLGRRASVIGTLYESFTDAGVEVLCVAHVLDNSPSGTMIRHMMSAVAEYQRSEWLGRMKTCKRVAVAKKGTYGGGRVPYGYVSHGEGQLAIDGDTADLVRRCFELKAAGGTLAAIADRLYVEGFRTKKGTRMAPMQVSRILARREVYKGNAPVQHVKLEQGVSAQQPEII